MAYRHTCPQCCNRYSEKFNDCPQCEIPLEKHTLTIEQKADGSHNQVVHIGGNGYAINNSGTIAFVPKEEIAHYHAQPVTKHDSFLSMIKGHLFKILGTIMVWLFQWLYGSFKDPSLATLQWMIAIVSLLIGARASFKIAERIDVLFTSSGLLQVYGNLYRLNSDQSIDEFYISGACPVEGCSGILHLDVPPKNQQGVKYAALCDRHGMRHAFEFNEDTYKGVRIQLIPAQEEAA